MNKFSKWLTKATKVLVAVFMMVCILGITAGNAFAEDPDYTGKTVILHTNDVHGNVANYQYVADVKQYFEGCGATVI